ncbi:hypothetical protein CEE45_17670 [Candidatus Heimdallarchaeota archaeon B3_Heim]|nr:MAG: hypothetical protein CEE45_17670 [Candidatus Heimdallarchaeota archaeon B3_Heim]
MNYRGLGYKNLTILGYNSHSHNVPRKEARSLTSSFRKRIDSDISFSNLNQPFTMFETPFVFNIKTYSGMTLIPLSCVA